MNISDSALYAESWNVAFRFEEKGSILENKCTPFNVIPNSIRYWAADPMVFEHEEKKYIFSELYDYVKCRGIIGVAVYLGNNRFSKWQPIIQEKFHMSYPFVFQAEGEIYMLPETSEKNEVILYRATKFPLEWEIHKVIKNNVKWVDTTIFPTKEGYQGFTQSIEQENIENLEIKLDKEFNLLSVKNCDMQDIKKYRSGGSIFVWNDKLVRVCQDCQEDYGKALYFRICDRNLVEKSSVRICPEQLELSDKMIRRGMHTYTALDDIEVIDIKTRRFNLINLLFRFLNKIRR